MRATVSPALPAVNGLMILTTRVGQVCVDKVWALAADAAAKRLKPATAQHRPCRSARIDRMSSSWNRFCGQDGAAHPPWQGDEWLRFDGSVLRQCIRSR